jgi:hypothetical protein
MANIETTNNKTRSLVLWEPVHADELVTFAGATTLLAGTILARDSVSLKLVPFVKGGSTNENGIPKAVLLGELTATGAGDLPCRPIVGGRLRKGDLVINADGDASNVDGAVVDQLRDYSIIALGTTQLAELDNQ